MRTLEASVVPKRPTASVSEHSRFDGLGWGWLQMLLVLTLTRLLLFSLQ